MPLHLRELRKGTRFMLMRTGDKFVYLGVGVSQYYAATHPGIASAPGRLNSRWRLVIVTRRLRPDGGSLRKQFCLRRAAVGCTKPERHHHPPGGTE